MSAQHPCPRCGALITVGRAYCARCAGLVEAERQQIKDDNRRKRERLYAEQRDRKYTAFRRSKAWKATSRAKLEDAHYRCEAGLSGCTLLATEVHHKEPIETEKGWDLRLDWSNLEATCTSCHNRRHPEKGRHGQGALEGVIDGRTILDNAREREAPGGWSEKLSDSREITGTEACRAERNPHGDLDKEIWGMDLARGEDMTGGIRKDGKEENDGWQGKDSR